MPDIVYFTSSRQNFFSFDPHLFVAPIETNQTSNKQAIGGEPQKPANDLRAMKDAFKLGCVNSPVRPSLPFGMFTLNGAECARPLNFPTRIPLCLI